MSERDDPAAVADAADEQPESWDELVRDLCEILGVTPLSERMRLKMARRLAELFPDAEADYAGVPLSATPPVDAATLLAGTSRAVEAPRARRVRGAGEDDEAFRRVSPADGRGGRVEAARAGRCAGDLAFCIGQMRHEC